MGNGPAKRVRPFRLTRLFPGIRQARRKRTRCTVLGNYGFNMGNDAGQARNEMRRFRVVEENARPPPKDHAMPLPDLAYAITVLLVAYFVRGISGFGSGLIAVPLLALRFPLPDVVPFILISDFTASALVGGVTFRHVAWPEIRRLLPASLVGVVLGTHLLVSLPPRLLLSILGGFVLAFALRSLLLKQAGFRPASTRWAWPAALTGGAVSGLFGTGGPPYVIYLSHRIADKGGLRATLSALFFLEGLIRVITFLFAGLLLDSRIWLHGLFALPLIVAALYVGGHVHTRLSHGQILRLVSFLLLGSAGSLLVKAWW